MGNAIAQSATQLAVSPTVEENFDFRASAKRAATKNHKGMTRERMLLNRGKLVSTVRNEFLAHYTSYTHKNVPGKVTLPDDIYSRIENAVDAFLNETMGRITVESITSFRRAFKLKVDDMDAVEETTIKGETIISLKEKHLAYTLAIGEAEKRLRKLAEKKTPDYDAETKLNNRVQALQNAQAWIQSEITRQATAVAE